MSCNACTRAETHPRTGYFHANCQSCEARGLAQSPAAHSRHADPSVLQGLMRRTWPDHDVYKRGRALTWHWITRLEKETA